MMSLDTPARRELLTRALRLELFTVAWNIAEGVIAVAAALAARSVALLGFGIDSFVESASAMVLIWRLGAERRDRDAATRAEELDQRARRLVGITLFLLAAYVAFDAITTLYRQERPGSSIVGTVLTSVSLGLMLWLAKAKRETAHNLGSRALAADAFQTTACWWLSLSVLASIGLNALFGWWWADPIAALAMTYFLVREGREAWQGERCCD